MAHHFRRPNGYWITKYKYDLYDYYRFLSKRPEPIDVREAHPEKNDVVLLYNNVHEVIGQREVLSKACQFFDKLLCGSFKEAKQTRIAIHNDVIEDPRAFIKMIDYIHKKTIILERSQVRLLVEILELCLLYLFDELRDIIYQFLADNIDSDTMIYIFAVAEKYDYSELKAKCLEYNYELMDIMQPKLRLMGVCPFPGHEDHHYLRCKSKIYQRC